MSNSPEIIIIGGGPAGLAAAIAAFDGGCRDILILEREKELGGILRQCIHPGFGLHRFKEELTGPEYAERFIRQVEERRIPVQCDTMVLEIAPDKSVTCISSEHGLQVFTPKAVILAMGCRERPRGALGIPGTRCAGIYSAGTAQRLVNLDGFMPGRRIVILGSGDIGLIMARRMTFEGAKVLAAVEIMPYSSGLKRNIVQCLDDYGIPLLLSHTVTQIHGRERLEGVTICAVDERRQPVKGTEQYIECDTLLLSVGLIPENELSKTAGVALDGATAGPVVDQRLETSVPGVFACGNVLHVHDLVDNVSEESEEAGRAAAEYVISAGGRAIRATVKDGFGVRGVVPRKIAEGGDAPIRFMFRPANVYRNARVEAVVGGDVIASWKRRILTPGEMVSLSLKCDAVPTGAEIEFRVAQEEK
ncbi:MAG: FAD-dependent oxidoreductase [Victivallales bacterium]|nr:FAD-dependent oxidoreductase [Victivallales bacterium]